MYVKQLNGYTVAQLKEELAARNLETVGKKAELLVRLAAYLEGKNTGRRSRSLAYQSAVQQFCSRDLVTKCLVEIYLWQR